ncbi:MAG: hypothetical protein FJ294_13970 [Planctomycetes bacterium]|nr:hypothetical protein [Planctomycetota bacterium]
MSAPLVCNPRLAAALLSALVHRINNTTQLLVVLRSVLSDPDEEVLASAGPDLAHASRAAEEQGWLLGLLARSLGTDLLLAREERDGLKAILRLLAETLRRERKELSLPAALPTMTLAAGSPRTAVLCLELAALVWESCASLDGSFALTLERDTERWCLRLSRADWRGAQAAFDACDCAGRGARLAADGAGWRLDLPANWLAERSDGRP